MNEIGKDIVSILLAVISLAIIAVLIRNGSNTGTVLSSFFKGFTGMLGTAESGGVTSGAVAGG